MARRAATISDLMASADAVRATVEELADGIGPNTAMNIIDAGYPDGLIGAHENEWLEVKSRPWDVGSTQGKIELAQDIAALANSGGGLIVVGASTRKQDGEETISRVHGVRTSLFRPHQIKMIADARVYPPVDGLLVRRAPMKDSRHEVGYIRVPPQDATNKPFLVHGAIAGRAVEGAFVSFVTRRGDQSLSTRASDLHAWLAAGRRLVCEGSLALRTPGRSRAPVRGERRGRK